MIQVALVVLVVTVAGLKCWTCLIQRRKMRELKDMLVYIHIDMGWVEELATLKKTLLHQL